MVSSIDSYSLLKKIGQGSFGEVWLVEEKDNEHNKFVLKKISFIRASEKERKAARQECLILRSLEHPNIVQYKDSFEENNSLYIAMAFCEGGDLYTNLEERDTFFPEKQIVEWLIQITMALSYIHERNILHRDLKTQNVFLTKSIIKIGDLGIAKRLKNKNDMAKTFIGTPYYMSPELFEKKPYNFKSDIWSLGCVTYEMATLKHAFNAKNFTALSYKIINGQTPDMPSKYSKELIILIQDMLNKSPDRRPNTTGILNNPFIQKHIQMFVENSKSKSERQRRDSSKLQKDLHDDKSEIIISSVESDNGSWTRSRSLSNNNEDSSKESSILVVNSKKRSKRREEKRSQGSDTFKFPNSNENRDTEESGAGDNEINENNGDPRRRRKNNSINQEDKTFVLPELKSVKCVEKDANNFLRPPFDGEIKSNIDYKKRKKLYEVLNNLDLDYNDSKTFEISEIKHVECSENDETNNHSLGILQVIEKMNETLNIKKRSENIAESTPIDKSQKESKINEPIENKQETDDRSKYFNELYPGIRKEIMGNVGYQNLNKCYEVLRNLDLNHEKELKNILNDDYERYCGTIIWLKMIEENMPTEYEKCITAI